jgi:hypothetical protein
MGDKRIPFAVAVREAARLIPWVWNADGQLNLTALARYYEEKGHPVSQPTLHRLFEGKHKPSDGVILATELVLRVPRSILRGEPMAADYDKLLGNQRLSTILLAQKLEELPKSVRDPILQLIDNEITKQEQLAKALQAAPNITPFDRTKPSR